jgi:hypothetical protein
LPKRGLVGVLSQTIQFLSLEPGAVRIGLDQVVPPLVERLVTTSTAPERMPSDEISHTLCLASKATEASLAARYRPPVLVVRPGSEPWAQVAPPLRDVAQPVSEAPPPTIRPIWNAATIVLPAVNVSGSTSVRCWACASVNGSVLTWVIATFAYAVVAANSNATAAAATGTPIVMARMDRIVPSPSQLWKQSTSVYHFGPENDRVGSDRAGRVPRSAHRYAAAPYLTGHVSVLPIKIPFAQ